MNENISDSEVIYSFEDKSEDRSLKSGQMPRLVPGEQNAPIFTGERIKEFLEVYELITSKNNSRERTLLFPFYCRKDLQLKIKRTISYENRDWQEFKLMLRRKFKEHVPDDPLESLKKLVSKEIISRDFFCFVDDFEYETSKLERSGDITLSQKSLYFIKALPSELVDLKEEEIYDSGQLLSYEKLLQIFSKLCTAKNNLRKVRKASQGIEFKDATKDEINSNGNPKQISDLIQQMSALTLLYQQNIEQKKISSSKRGNMEEFTPTCIYCDGPHEKRNCKVLDKDLELGVVKLNQKYLIINSAGEILQPNWGKGGIKANIINSSNSRLMTAVLLPENITDASMYNQNITKNSTMEIIPEEEFTNIVAGLATKRKLINNNGTEGCEKDKQNKEDTQSSKRTKETNITEERAEKNNNSIDSEDIPLMSQLLETPNSRIPLIESETDIIDLQKYKVKANVVKDIYAHSLIQKCKELKIEVSLEELASVSPLLRKSLNDEFKLKRIADVSRVSIPKALDGGWSKKYIAVGSGRIMGRIQGAEVNMLFDEGSEVNIMSKSVYTALESLGRAKMNTTLKWQMKDANSGLSSLVGMVPHCVIEIQSCKVEIPIFVSDTIKEAVILGRPWETKSRVLKDNRADSSLWYTIIDEFDGSIACFCVNDNTDTLRYEMTQDIEANYLVASKRIEILNQNQYIYNQLNQINYIADVRTRYKKIINKIKPVATQLLDHKSPGLLDTYIQKNSKCKLAYPNSILSKERLEKMVIGNGNLTLEEADLFYNCLKRCSKAFAFEPKDMGLLKETIELPVKAETVSHVPWTSKQIPVPRAIVDESLLMVRTLTHGLP
ncbi:hypothetical protein BB561_005031 [Smittium simulii]|uniref:Peptidase A2 domain-containing protein n=1 Tax=Smittium simulii TaxID=133385 RepID=A0A2T9YCN0_9FUNG|nr:hypothetical protein BB561_005031 [Smittium simulii]